MIYGIEKVDISKYFFNYVNSNLVFGRCRLNFLPIRKNKIISKGVERFFLLTSLFCKKKNTTFCYLGSLVAFLVCT